VSRLRDLFEQHGQSPWLDNLRRDWIVDGTLAKWVDRGVRGVTSNPTIFQKAISGSTAYDEQFNDLVSGGADATDAYWSLVTEDITAASRILAPVHESSGGGDGFVSLEVAPDLARDTDSTITAATRLWNRIEAPNLMIKIPGTAEGIPAIRAAVAAGLNVNITLLFSVERYGEVIDAYFDGLEDRVAEGRNPALVRSVASFFISRVDTEVDRRLVEVGSPDARALQGRAAVAQARAAYQLFRERFTGSRWSALAAMGARVQRPLWASTSTKNPDYPETLYVDSLIGPDTVNTLPEDTLDAFDARGRLDRTIDANPAEAKRTLDELAQVGVDMADVARRLEDEGVAAFAKSFDELITVLTEKAAALT
jgi:transaldolase